MLPAPTPAPGPRSAHLRRPGGLSVPYRPYRPTAHAEQRRLEMHLGTKEIKRALNDPETIYPGDPKYAPARFYQRGRLVVVFNEDRGEVITLLWHRATSRTESP